MNRFRTKKKGKDDTTSNGRSSQDSENTSMPSFKNFRRGKKSQEEEPKKEFNLESALPSENDFRTSLLMTNLSARFSMLREQDDPNTKIGKASDDSVLFPKRQSRLMDLGFGGAPRGLADIAEVESIRAQPAYARMDSFMSDETEMKADSMMNRSKPTEGNVLFGGRQKIYKVPVGSASGKTGDGGAMTGRVLYDDDVAMSAFQRWRQAEKDRNLEANDAEEEVDQEEAENPELQRSESPMFTSYSRKRETSSTTSSAIARNSTAANSIASQPAASIKDWQSVSTAPTSVASTPALERSVTRTKRLYEQSLTQELQEQQTSALSRMDTLTRQRPFGSRTPDLGANSPSPTSLMFSERLGERRPVLAKSSAPNLRSMSPPASGSSMGTMDLGIQVPATSDSKPEFGGSPPLSPPISETGEYPLLSIQPNDRGKATAMGVFQKPAQPYDESKYAQRQLQLQQGRETPTQRSRTESNASFATGPAGRSRSSSSLHRQPLEAKLSDSTIQTEPTVHEEAALTDFSESSAREETAMSNLLEDSESPVIPTSAKLPSRLPPPPPFQRPSDKDHPAFRQSALPTPLSMGFKLSTETSPISEKPEVPDSKSNRASPLDSPTLGPGGGAGLSGLVRQHLRSDSNTSSIYGGAPTTAGLDSRFPVDPHELDGLGARSNPWVQQEQEWAYGGTEPTLEDLKNLDTFGDGAVNNTRESTGEAPVDETDEFADQLAAARRRVREKLTSFVESDSSRSGSPQQTPAEFPRDVNNLGPPNSLGIGILKQKSSRGSLADRSRSMVGPTNKASKILGLGVTTSSPIRPSFDEKEVAPTDQEIPNDETARKAGNPFDLDVNEEEDDANAPPGVRAFRQARRDLQKRREHETSGRQQAAATSVQPPVNQFVETAAYDQAAALGRERVPPQRAPSRERKAPQVAYQRGAPRPSVERNRSDSEAGRPRTRSNSRPPPPRMRKSSTSEGERAGASRSPMHRPPGLPGTDIRRSPMMPPQALHRSGQASPGPSPQPHPLDRSQSAGNLKVHAIRQGYEAVSGQPSPISPLHGGLGLPPSASGSGSNSGSTPNSSLQSRQASAPHSPGVGGTTTSTLNEGLKRVVDKRDISEPTFIMSTSRVPTVNLPQSVSIPDTSTKSRSRSRSRSRSNSSGKGAPSSPAAPPVPPINPRRKREGSRARAALDALRGRRGETPDDLGFSAPAPAFAASAAADRGSSDLADENRSAFSISDDEDGSKSDQRRRLRKANADAMAMNARVAAPGSTRDNSASYVVRGPPASRAMTTGGTKPTGRGFPGGMI